MRKDICWLDVYSTFNSDLHGWGIIPLCVWNLPQGQVSIVHCVCAFLCDFPVVNWNHVQGLPALCPKSPGIGSGFHTT